MSLDAEKVEIDAKYIYEWHSMCKKRNESKDPLLGYHWSGHVK